LQQKYIKNIGVPKESEKQEIEYEISQRRK
jgi:hypothetical protein